MTQYTSPRGFVLAYSGTPVVQPVLTCEVYLKWYHLFLVQPDQTVTVAPLDLDELEQYSEGETVVGDHCWNPYVLQRLADAKDWLIDDVSFELILGRWVTDHLGGLQERDEEDAAHAAWEEDQEEESFEDEMWDEEEKETKDNARNVYRSFPNNVLVALRRMLKVEKQLPGPGNPFDILVSIEVLTQILREDRGVDPDNPAWEQGPVRQVLSEFPDDILKLIVAGMNIDDRYDAPSDFYARRTALIKDILKTRIRGPGRTDIDEGFADDDLVEGYLLVVEDKQVKAVRQDSSDQAVSAYLSHEGLLVHSASYKEPEKPGLLPLGVVRAMVRRLPKEELPPRFGCEHNVNGSPCGYETVKDSRYCKHHRLAE